MRVEDLHLAFASGAGNKIILFGARTGLDGIGGVSVLATRDVQRRRLRGRQQEAPERAGRRPVHREGAHRVLPGALRRRAGGRHPGPRRRGAVVRHLRARQRRRRRHAHRAGPRPAARHRHDPGGGPLQRVAGADVRGRDAGERRRLPRRLREVGHARHGDRRGHRRRPAGDHLARGDRRRRAAAHRRPRRPGLRSARSRATTTQDALVADAPDRLPRPAAPSELRAEILRMAASPNLCSRAWVTDQYDRYVRGNTALGPTRRRRDGPGGRARPGAASPSPPTATPASSRSTRTRAPSSRSPRPTATSRRPAPCRRP